MTGAVGQTGPVADRSDEGDIPGGEGDVAPSSWPPRTLIDSFLGAFPHDFELRPGETVPVDSEEAQEDARLFRDVLGSYASGVTVVTTTTSDGEPVGMTCQSFTSVSLDPPLVAFLPTRESRAFKAIRRAGHFCAGFLSTEQVEIADQMAGPRDGADKFIGVGWSPSRTGSPLLDGVVGYVDCTVDAVHEAGDHYIVVGRVVDLGLGDGDEPLLFYRGRYTTVDR